MHLVIWNWSLSFQKEIEQMEARELTAIFFMVKLRVFDFYAWLCVDLDFVANSQGLVPYESFLFLKTLFSPNLYTLISSIVAFFFL